MTALGGLILIRALPKQEYALWAVLASMQSTCQALAELGTGMGTRAIGGRTWNQPIQFGELLRTGLLLKRRFAVIAFAICLPITGWLLRGNGASPAVAVLLSAAMLVALIPLLGTSTWLASAQLHGEYRRIQRLDLGSAAIRLGLLGTLCLVRLNAVLAVLAGAAGNWVQALMLRKWAYQKTAPARFINLEYRSELVRLSLNSLPNTLFFCVQGQVLIIILTLFGSPTSLAELTALGRLAALFAVFSVAFNNILVPKFARCQQSDRLLRLYLGAVAGTMVVLGILSGLSWLWPKPFLWLLGGQYTRLLDECGWVVTAGCVGQLGALMWNLNSSRAWIRVQAVAYIPVVLSAQVIAAFALNLNRFHDVLVFNLLVAAAPVPIYAADAVLGLRHLRQFNCEHGSARRPAF